MELRDAIFTRRSVRKYNDKPVSEKTVELLLKAAMQAPSARNTQPWCFVVINQRDLLTQIPDVHPYAKMIASAALGILVCADTEVQPNVKRWCQDLGAATQNLLLAAHAEGLGAVWLGVYGAPDRVAGIKKLIKLPEHLEPYSLISIGYSDDIPTPVDRFKPERIFYNQF